MDGTVSHVNLLESTGLTTQRCEDTSKDAKAQIYKYIQIQKYTKIQRYKDTTNKDTTNKDAKIQKRKDTKIQRYKCQPTPFIHPRRLRDHRFSPWCEVFEGYKYRKIERYEDTKIQRY